MNDVRDRLGLQGMQGPEQRHEQGEGRGGAAERRCQQRQTQRAPHNSEQEQRRASVNEQVEEVIAGCVKSSERVVHGQRGIDHGAAAHGDARARGRKERGAEAADTRVGEDGVGVVEEERHLPRIRVGHRQRGDDHADGTPAPSRAIRWGRGSRGGIFEGTFQGGGKRPARLGRSPYSGGREVVGRYRSGWDDFGPVAGEARANLPPTANVFIGGPRVTRRGVAPSSQSRQHSMR